MWPFGLRVGGAVEAPASGKHPQPVVDAVAEASRHPSGEIHRPPGSVLPLLARPVVKVEQEGMAPTAKGPS